MILSHGGLAGLWTPGCQGAALVAAAELNAAGGVNGREIQIVNRDSGETPQSAFAAARKLALDDRVDAVIGLQASHLRSSVRRGLGGLAPYIYTPHYEGGTCGPGTASLGVTDQEVLTPGIAWLAERRRAERFFFCGNDYIWPRIAFDTTRAAVRSAGGTMVGHALIDLHDRDYAPVLDRIKSLRPDVVVIALLGEDAVAFNRAFAEAGLAKGCLRLMLAFEETQLLAVAPENAENLFAGASYFQGTTDHGRDALMENYHSSFGGTLPDVTTNSLNCYDAVYLVAAMARRNGHTDGHLMARQLGRRLPRSCLYEMIGRTAISARVVLAEANGTTFSVRQTWHA